jgi:hypothetical protein
MVENIQPADTPPNRALRLTFEYEGSSVRLVSSQTVDMILPPSHPLEARENETGFWFTLADAAGKPVYRRIVQNPIRLDREVFSQDPKKSIHRLDQPKPKGSFVVLVPDFAPARTLILFSHPLELKSAAAPARELRRFNLSELEKKQ